MRKILGTLIGKIIGEIAKPSPGGPQTSDKSWAAGIGVFLTYLAAALGFADWPSIGDLDMAIGLIAKTAAEGAGLAVTAGLGAWLKRNRPKAGDGVKLAVPWPAVLAALALAVSLSACAASGAVGDAASKAADRALTFVAERLDDACDTPGADLLQDALVASLNERMERNEVTGIVCVPKASE